MVNKCNRKGIFEAILVCVMLTAAGGQSCSDRSESVALPTPSSAGALADSYTVHMILDAWAEESHEFALEVLVVLANEPDSAERLRAFEFSELQWQQLPQQDRDRLGQVISIDRPRTMFRVGRAAIERGVAARDRGEIDEARRWFQAAKRLGQANDRPPEEIVAVGRVSGRKLITLADRELDLLP